MTPQELGPGNIWFPIAFVLVMMVAAALISAAADRMGHRAARRKLRIGKLRPRHVSTLIAIISGVVIALVTVGVMFLIWHDFYLALTQWDNLNGRLAQLQKDTQQAEQDRDTALADVKQAQADLTQARGQIESQSIEIRQKVAQIAETRSKLGGAQAELGRSQHKLAGLKSRVDAVDRELAKKRAEQRELEKQVTTAYTTKEQILDKVRADVAELESERDDLLQQIAKAQTGQRVFSVHQQLGYVKVKSGANMSELLEAELTKIKAKIEAQGLEFDPGSRDKVVDFVNEFPANGDDYLVRILAAENVFEGDRVLLDFEYEPLRAIVPAGTAVLDIALYDNRAVLSGLAGVKREIKVPAQLSGDSMVDFFVEAENTFQRGAKKAGFVPGDNGDVASPVTKLTAIADDLPTRERPLRIQFVTRSSATALDGDVLAGAEVHVTSLPKERTPAATEQPEQTPPDETTEPEPTPDAPSEDGNPG